jgi:hypothetical protein
MEGISILKPFYNNQPTPDMLEGLSKSTQNGNILKFSFASLELIYDEKEPFGYSTMFNW